MATFEVPNGTPQIMCNNMSFSFERECYKAHPLLVSLFSFPEPWRSQDRYSYAHFEGEEWKDQKSGVFRGHTDGQS